MSFAKFTASGRIASDFKFKEYGKEKKDCVLNFSIATSTRVKNGENWEEVPNFFNVSIFGHNARFINTYLDKGDGITVEGDLKQENWESSEGEKRSRIVLNARDFEQGRKKGDGTSQESGKKAEKTKTDDNYDSEVKPEDLPF